MDKDKEQEFECEIEAPCFQALSQPEISLIKQGKTQIQFRRGENLTKQGGFAAYVMFVVKGLIKQYIEDENGRNLNLQIIQPGDFIGLSAVFDKPVFQYSTVAITDCTVFMVDKQAMKTVLTSNGKFAFNIIMRYNEQSDVLYSVLRTLTYKQMNGRLADTLLYLCSLPYSDTDVFGNLTRKDIADFAGISTESAVKLLKMFEKDGIISLNDKLITILNKSQLQEISKHG